MLNNQEKVAAWLDEMNIKNYTITEELIVHVNDSVDLSERGLTQFPVQFGHIKGDFNCYSNEISSLKGSPFIIDGSGYFSCNYLNNLHYLPTKVGYELDLAWNQLNNVISLFPLIHFLKNNSLDSLYFSLNTQVDALYKIGLILGNHPMYEPYDSQYGYDFDDTEKINHLVKYLDDVYSVFEKHLLEKSITQSAHDEKKIKL